MLTKQDIDNMILQGNFTNDNSAKYAEQRRMQALMDVVSKVDANDPQKIMELSTKIEKNGLYGYYGWTNVDVATLIFRFATKLKDENNFDKVMEELKKRGIPDKTFGDAFVTMQKEDRFFPAKYIKKVMEMAKGQYSKEWFDKLYEKDFLKASDPFFAYAFNHQDKDALKKYGIDIDEVMAIDTSPEKQKIPYPGNKVRIASKDGKYWIDESLPRLAYWKSQMKLKIPQNQDAIENNIMMESVRDR